MGGVHDIERRGMSASAAGGGLVLGTKLRLAAAGMTDVGRRRERNQDNTTHRVPSDERTLAEKGALFVVCDGMGGHAAGEVASEIGVNTIRDEYYTDTSADVITGIAHAIKSANEHIYGYAHEHAEMAGMGTTCVTLLIHGGRAYIVNIGDSRAYLVRDGSMRQVTLDHSWVAEQVRAGVLTEEQARTHAHRNVITRSLGTQPTVNADLFVEALHNGDRLLLCSDGLHGYVEERDIEHEMLQHEDPELGVRALIDMANDNGGPDNITAVIVHLLEVPPVTGELALPDAEETGITQPLPTIAAQRRAPSKVAAAASVAGVEPAEKSVPRRARGGRLALAAIRVLAVAALVAIAAGVWDFTAGPYSEYRAAVSHVQRDITEARSVVLAARHQQPGDALAALAVVRDRLTADTQATDIDDQVRQDAQRTLAESVEPAVQAAVQGYNTGASISNVPLGGVHTYPMACGAPGAAPETLQSLTAIATLVTGPTAATGQTLYTLDAGRLYMIATPLDTTGPAGGAATCVPLALPPGITPSAIATDGPGLFALTPQSDGYAVVALSPDGANPDNTPKVKADTRAVVHPATGEIPKLVAVSGDNISIASQSTLWVFSGQPPKQTSTKVVLPTAAISLVAAGSDIYALLADGSIAVSHAGGALLVGAPVAVPPALTRVAPGDYNIASPIPTVGSPIGQAGSFGNGAILAIDPTQAGSFLVGDGAHSRLVRLVAGNGTTSYASQHVYDRPIDDVSQLALSATKPAPNAKAQINVYLWSGHYLVAFSIAD